MDEILEARRKALLRTMLLGIFLLVCIAFVVEVIESWDYLEDEFMIPLLVAALIFIPILLVINKRAPSWIAALIW